MVARIAAERIDSSVAVSDFRSRAAVAEVRSQPLTIADDPLPPVLEPVPTPVPTPAIVPPTQAFEVSQLVEHMPVQATSPDEVRLRLGDSWQAPISDLHLKDRRV